jgi:tetratricopeptide (TPR) repeat protein
VYTLFMVTRHAPARTPAAVLLACLIWAPGLRGDEDQAAEILRLTGAGETAYLRGDYETARPAYEKAWDLAQQSAPENPVRYDVLKRLTAINAATGKYPEAENYLQQAITWRENQFGSTDSKFIDDLIEVSTLCRRMKDYERALVVLDRVWSLHQRSVGANRMPLADDMTRRAQIYLDQKKPQDAADALLTGLVIRTNMAGADSPFLLADLDLLGSTQITLRQYDKAEETYRHALVIRERLYGKEHADLLATLDGLAYACFGQKKYDVAEPIYFRLIALWESSASKEHPMLATVLDKLAIFYGEQKKWEEAKAAADRAIAIRAHFLATGFAYAANLKLSEGDNKAAAELCRRALAVLDPPDPIYDELRKEIESNLKLLDPPPPPAKPRAVKKTPPPRR